MNHLLIFFLSIGLAMDCFAVSAARGVCMQKFKWNYALRISLLFGLFQAIMPLISYYSGRAVSDVFTLYDHWIAFGLLLTIGIKMIYESSLNIKPDCKKQKHPFRWKSLFVMSFATSIDAFASGVIFIPYPEYVFSAILLIGSISVLFSLFGLIVGFKLGHKLRFNVEILGGIILIILGIKILFEHLLKN